jgi:thiol-disulfide isomerase/thioredoxin
LLKSAVVLCVLLGLGLTPPALAAVESDSESEPARSTAPRKPAHVPWVMDLTWSAAVNRAADAGQPILLDFWAPWCGPCKLLDGFVFNEPEVIAELADVLTMKVDIDRPENAHIKDRFNISLLPTLVWCDPTGTEVDRFTGAVSADEFLELVRTMRQDGNTFLRLQQMVARSPEEPGLLFDLARRHADRGDTERAGILYRRMMGLRFRAEKRVVVDGMLGLAAIEEKSGHGERARDIVRRAASSFGRQEEGGKEVLMAVAAYQGALADTSGMLETYRLLIDFDDTDVLALEGYARTAAAARRDLQQATKYAIRAVVMGDEAPRLMALVARCYHARQAYSRSVRWMQKACAAEPENASYAAELARYQEAQATRPFHSRGRRR